MEERNCYQEGVVHWEKEGNVDHVPIHVSSRLLSSFFAVLLRLHTAASVKEMAHRFGVFFSKLFTTWVTFLAFELQALHEVPLTKPRVLIK